MKPDESVLPAYRRMREVHRALNSALLKTLTRKALEESARRLGLLRGHTIMIDREEDMNLLSDTTLYDYFARDGRNAVERFASQYALEGDEKVVFDAMLGARFTAIELADVVEGVGVYVADLVFGGRFLLADVMLSGDAVPGLVLGTRILDFGAFSMTSGAHVVFDDRVSDLVVKAAPKGAGFARAASARDRSMLAHLLLQAGLAEPDDAFMALAQLAATWLPMSDPRREAFARLRAER